jgi:hypothetical protein
VSRLKPKVGPVALALTAWDIWRRLPPRQRKQLINVARTHGPRIAARAMHAGARAREARAARKR